MLIAECEKQYIPKSISELTQLSHSTKSKKQLKSERLEKYGRKALSPYLIYHNQRFREVRKQNEGLSNAQIAKIIGKEWKGLSEEEKKVYGDMHRREKERLKEERGKEVEGGFEGKEMR